jgi:hypothetical protein
VERKKREFHADLPPRSDPNYMKMYNLKNKERVKEKTKEWYKEKVESNPNFWKERYDKDAAHEYRLKNKKILSEKQWKKRGIIDLTYEKFLQDLQLQKNKCKICDSVMVKPQADHDHKTGKYRGLLCVPCNNGLGVYENNKESFEKYLMEAIVK